MVWLQVKVMLSESHFLQKSLQNLKSLFVVCYLAAFHPRQLNESTPRLKPLALGKCPSLVSQVGNSLALDLCTADSTPWVMNSLASTRFYLEPVNREALKWGGAAIASYRVLSPIVWMLVANWHVITFCKRALWKTRICWVPQARKFWLIQVVSKGGIFPFW